MQIINKTRTTLVMTALICSIALYSVPANRDAFSVTQPDGTKLTLFNHGDEFFHYLTDEAGRMIIETETGEYIAADEQFKHDFFNSKRQARHITSIIADKKNPAHYNQQNITQHGLIILANFADLTFLEENSRDAMQEMFSGEHYDYNEATGSARQYFCDQSSGLYNPDFDVVGPVTLPNNFAYYGSNNRTGDERRAYIAIMDACRIADSLLNVDFTKYDNDNDGVVDFVYVIYAGHNEAEGASTTTIWPHAWNLLGAGIELIIDGKQIGTYACSSELRGNTGEIRAGIGTFCHEFSHVLGLPDLYATVSGTTHRTLGAWDIMDYGPYNNAGRTPPAYSAYERFCLGWTQPTLLNTPNDYFIRDIQSSNACAMITSNGQSNLSAWSPDPDTFYMLENRQQTGWDTFLPGHGLMITKVQYNKTSWYNNTVNNDPDNMGVDLIEASGNTTARHGIAEDLFPAGAAMYVPYTFYPVLKIEENDAGDASFQFMSGGAGRESVEIIGQLPTSIETPEHDSDEEIVYIHTASGQNIGSTNINELPMGVYIITSKSKNANSTLQTKKIYVKKI